MMKKFLLLFVAFNFVSCNMNVADLANIATEVLGNGQLSSLDIGNGLKQALEVGIGDGASKLSQKNGYFNSAYKILLPKEAREVTDRLKKIPGFDKVEAELLKRLNAGAEDAAKQAKPIFVDAIKSMTFDDAMGILMGQNNAATSYLNNKTNNKLYASFNPVIVKSLNKFNAIKYWEDLVTKYNKIPFVKKMNPRLDDYVTQQALTGLFSMVEKKELGIRKDVNQRSTDLLRRVFAKQDNK